MSPVTIKQLFYYPVKSCAGIEVIDAQVGATGLLHDRQWMVVDANSVFVTQRERPELALVFPRVANGVLSLSAPQARAPDLVLPADQRNERIQVEIFGERYPAMTVSESADRWFSEYLKSPHRLVAFDQDVLRKGGVQYPRRDEAPTLFPDNFGLLVVSDASLADLNRRMRQVLPVNRFRPNVVLSGLNAYEEDFLVGIKSGGSELRFVDLCFRCNLTTIDQSTTQMGEEPLKTLLSYRVDPKNSGVKFGAYFAVENGTSGRLRVGDEAEITWSF
jgi:uncharacterized protein YcbX